MTQEYSLLFGPFKLDFPRRTLSRDGTEIRLGSRAMEILVALAEATGDLVGNQALVARVWPDTVVDEGSLRVHMSAVRKALEDGKDGNRYVVNEMGRGYRLAVPVQRTVHSLPAGSPAVRRNLRGGFPGVVGRVVGRDDVIEGLSVSLSERRLMTIAGSGGIGKTTVALSVANRFSSQTGIAAVFVDFAPVTSAASAATAVAVALGVGVSGDDPVPDVLAASGNEPMLLVFDNCEHLVDAITELAERMLRGTDTLRVLVTSREPLRAEGEWVHRLAPLAIPSDCTNVSYLDACEYPAIALFAERAAAVNGSFTVTPENVEAVCEVCRRIDGIPLAIEMAAARIASMDVHTLAARLEDRFAVLTRGRRTALPRQQTLRAMLDWSYTLLDESTQTVLLRLSVFRSSFDIDAAVAIVSDSEIDEFTVVDATADLVAKSMLVSDSERGLATYRFLETTRQYALEKLINFKDQAQVRRKHARYCASLFDDPAAAWEGGAKLDVAEASLRHLDDVRAALDWALSPDGDPALGVQLTTITSPLWFQLSLPFEFMRIAQRAVDALDRAGLTGTVDHVHLLNAYGHAIWHTAGPVEAMAEAFGRSLSVARDLRDLDIEMTSMWGLWSQRLQSGQYAESLAITQAYQRLAETSSELRTTQTAKHTHALSLERLGEFGRSLDLIEDVLVVDNANPVRAKHANAAQVDGRTAAWTLKMRILWIQGRSDVALELAREAVAECVRVDHALSLCFCVGMGVLPVAFWTGDLKLAREALSVLRSRTRGNGLMFWDSWADGFEAILTGGHFNLERATLYQMEIFATLGHEPSIDVLNASRRADVPTWCQAELVRRRAVTPYNGETQERELKVSLDIATRQGAMAWGLRAAISLARLLEERGDREDAHGILLRALRPISEGRDTADMREATALLAELGCA